MTFVFETRLRIQSSKTMVNVQEVNMTEVNVLENLTLLTRRSVKFKGKDEEISDVKINTAFIRGPALPGAAVRETANSEETRKYRVNTAFICGPALPGAAVRETANSEETRKLESTRPSFAGQLFQEQLSERQQTAKRPAKVKWSSPLTLARGLQRQ